MHGDGACLWERFLQTLTRASLELEDMPGEEQELTALLSELGFTAIERARLRRLCRSKIQEHKCILETKIDEAVTKYDELDLRLDESACLPSGFFGDCPELSIDVDTMPPVAACAESSLYASSPGAAPGLGSPSKPSSPIDDNVFLTGDYFDDHPGLVSSSVTPAVPADHPAGFVSSLFASPPHLSIQMPQAPTPADTLAIGSVGSLRFPGSSHAMQIQFSELLQQTINPMPNSQELPSIGSRMHLFDLCKPCAYVFDKGCSNGSLCEYCHLCPPGELKRRQKVRRSAQRRSRYNVL